MDNSRLCRSPKIRPSHRCRKPCVVTRSIPRLYNTGYNTFIGVYAGSVKEPDFFITPDAALYPSIVVECGWSESFPRLGEDENTVPNTASKSSFCKSFSMYELIISELGKPSTGRRQCRSGSTYPRLDLSRFRLQARDG